MKKITDKKEMLNLIRLDRPEQVINEVLEITENPQGYYDVKVDMQTRMFGTTILHSQYTIPYPISKYREMSN